MAILKIFLHEPFDQAIWGNPWDILWPEVSESARLYLWGAYGLELLNVLNK